MMVRRRRVNVESKSALRPALLAACLACAGGASLQAAEATDPVPEHADLHALVHDLTGPPFEAERMEAACQALWLVRGASGAQGRESPCSDLAVTSAEQAALDARAKEQAAAMVALGNEKDPALSEAGRAFVAALDGEDWKEAAERYHDVSRLLPEAVARQAPAVALLYMLRGVPPANALSELMDRMGELPPETILTLVEADMYMALEPDLGFGADLDAEALATLEEHGLDPRFVDADGRNAIHRVMARYFKGGRSDEKAARRALWWVRYLTSRGVSPSGGAGWDPLATALQAFLMPDGAAAGILMARGLLEAGAEVDASHRAVAALIRAFAPDAYAELLAAIPELG